MINSHRVLKLGNGSSGGLRKPLLLRNSMSMILLFLLFLFFLFFLFFLLFIFILCLLHDQFASCPQIGQWFFKRIEEAIAPQEFDEYNPLPPLPLLPLHPLLSP